MNFAFFWLWPECADWCTTNDHAVIGWVYRLGDVCYKFKSECPVDPCLDDINVVLSFPFVDDIVDVLTSCPSFYYYYDSLTNNGRDFEIIKDYSELPFSLPQLGPSGETLLLDYFVG